MLFLHTITPVGVNIIRHVIKVIIELLNPQRRHLGGDLDLVLVIQILGVPQLPGVEADLLLLLLVVQPSTLVPHLQGAAYI